jgi:hypothetical protein
MQIFVQLPESISKSMSTSRIIAINYDGEITVGSLYDLLNKKVPKLHSVQYFINTLNYVRLNVTEKLENQTTYNLTIKLG